MRAIRQLNEKRGDEVRARSVLRHSLGRPTHINGTVALLKLLVPQHSNFRSQFRACERHLHDRECTPAHIKSLYSLMAVIGETIAGSRDARGLRVGKVSSMDPRCQLTSRTSRDVGAPTALLLPALI